MGIAGVVSFFILIKTEAYRMNRFLVFLHPELDPRGIGYQINQALLAIGSGGILGVGLGKSLQKFNYLPEPVGDSIFAIIGEELGLLGCSLVLVLFAILAFRGLRIIKLAPDRFSRLAATGIVAWIIVQAFVNIAAISGINTTYRRAAAFYQLWRNFLGFSFSRSRNSFKYFQTFERAMMTTVNKLKN
jgi:cell division protein FtsW